jgi:hypothetical protein
MRTNVYVDGFNLYYGCLKGTPYRWLDLEALCSRLLPTNSIHRIRYFTARVLHVRTSRTTRSTKRPISVRSGPFPP